MYTLKNSISTIGVMLVAVAAVCIVTAPAAPAAAAPAPAPAATVEPETCAICHKNSGATPQTYYDQLYQDGVIKVTDVKYSSTAPGTTVITFKMTKNGAPFNGKDADSLNLYFVPYDGKNFQFADGSPRLSLKGKPSYEGGTTTRSIDAMPSYVTGPATRVCGSCHRATLLKEDNAGELTVLNLHFRNGGYLVEAGKDPSATLQDVIKQIMPIFTK
jgi:cytochrome c553